MGFVGCDVQHPVIAELIEGGRFTEVWLTSQFAHTFFLASLLRLFGDKVLIQRTLQMGQIFLRGMKKGAEGKCLDM